MNDRISLELGDRSYAVHVGRGLTSQAGEFLAPLCGGIVPVVTDRNVASLHLERLMEAIRGRGLEPRPIVLEPGESSKTFQGLERLSDALLNCSLDRNSLIVAFGGGVVGDLAGLAAGLLKRGIAYAQIPTTLLAQVDSSIGGKTAINAPQGKNLIGLFHQPRIVISDIDLLSTLPRREFLSGYAEVAKYAALNSPEFFSWLELNAAAISDRDAAVLVPMVARCCRIKAAIVGQDEREAGTRTLLNLGHTFGHALEAATGYSDRLLHGEGVAIGMVLAFRLSARLGFSTKVDTERLERHLRAMSLPTTVSDIPGPNPSPEAILVHMSHDKKVRGGQIALVLVRGIGQAFTTSDVSIEAIRALLAA
jgi:3-dehydroquinate synthase